jgi:uncharacterized protein YicC (UPF0701 family)
MTNNLTNDVTRLCGEIAALRDSRAELMNHLAQTHAAMREAVVQTLAGFAEARGQMAKQARAELGGFVGRVKEAVTELRQRVANVQEEYRDDLTGANRAWHGARPQSRPPAAAGADTPFPASESSEDLAHKGRKKKR